MNPRTLPPDVPVAVLRVYEPAQAFPDRERARWAGELARPDASERAAAAERRESWRRVLRRPAGATATEASQSQPGWSVGSGDGPCADPLAGYAWVLRLEGALLLCPASLGDEAGLRRTLVRAWDLPLPWLAVVALSGRRAQGPGGGSYLSPMGRARAQAARALRTLRVALSGTELVVEVEFLARWLEGFHPRSWVELDVRQVAALVGGDDGLEDVRLGLECLTEGDSAGVAEAYQRLRQRSRLLTDISRLS